MKTGGLFADMYDGVHELTVVEKIWEGVKLAIEAYVVVLRCVSIFLLSSWLIAFTLLAMQR